MMLRKQSILSGEFHTMDLPTVTKERLDSWKMNNKLVQDIFPELNVDEREFLMTGITAEERAQLEG